MWRRLLSVETPVELWVDVNKFGSISGGGGHRERNEALLAAEASPSTAR